MIQWILIIIVLIFIYYGINKYIHHYHYISFKESIALTGIPIVTFYQEENKYHFLIDTGADASYLNSKLVDSMITVPLEGSASAIGAGGERIKSYFVKSAVVYDNKIYPWRFRVTDLTAISEGAGLVVKGTPVVIAGIIGSDFLKYYQYQLDFQKLIAYSKK